MRDQDTIETAVDRTLILDVEKLWPSALSCPDWPFETATRRYDGQRGRAGAEAQLERLNQLLNRSGKVHAPSAYEREAAFARVFSPQGNMFHELGITNLSALDRTTEEQARLMVAAAHIRGYLRKLDALQRQAAAANEHRRLSEARQTLESYRSTAPAQIGEINALSEAAARHQQRIDDEQAFDRHRMLRDNLATLHTHAVAAAHELGLSVPDAPEIL